MNEFQLVLLKLPTQVETIFKKNSKTVQLQKKVIKKVKHLASTYYWKLNRFSIMYCLFKYNLNE